MNAKKAKALRKLTRNLAESRQDGDIALPQVDHQEMESRAKTMVTLKDENDPSKGIDRVKISSGQIVNGPASIRGIYRHLKRELVRTENGRKQR